MNKKRLAVLLAATLCSATLLTGCSFESVKSGLSERVQNLFGKTEEITQDDESDSAAEKTAQMVDESVEKPEFLTSFGGAVQITMGSVYGITCPAEVSEGTITYQWYRNNVDSNGGGTPIEGADTEVIAIDSSEPSHSFYYVVATNEVDGKINRAASNTLEVIVWDIGTWQVGEDGVTRYMMIDGTYPTSTWFMIDENFCYVKENGSISTGLVEIGGLTYYFSDEGYLQRNVTGPNGETVDENGVAHSNDGSAAENSSEGESSTESTEGSTGENTGEAAQ